MLLSQRQKNMNILIVVPRFVKKGEFYTFPYGLAYISSSLKQAGFNVSCLNLCHEIDDVKTEISKSVHQNNIDIVCTGGMSIHWVVIENMLNDIKEISQNLITVVGGAIITADPIFSSENMKVDFGVIGEGEETIIELMTALKNNTEISNVRGILYRDLTNDIIINDPRPPISDLDSLPFPDYEGLGFGEWLSTYESSSGNRSGILYDYDKPRIRADVIASRSCPYNCTFCYHPLGNKYRKRSLDSFFNEVEYLIKMYKINTLMVQDELFSLNEDRINEFTERIKKYGLQWSAQCRADNISIPLLKKLKDSNIMFLLLGIESMNDTVLLSMKKRLSKAQIEDAFEMSSQVGVRCIGNIIIGDPVETIETMNESLSWCKEHPEYDIEIRHVRAIPDSALWRYALENNIIKDKAEFFKEGFPVINLTSMSDRTFFSEKIKIEINSTLFKNMMSGEIHKYVTLPDSTLPGTPIYQFDAICPVCKKTSTYKHPKWTYFSYTAIICKHCFKRFKVPTYKITNESIIKQLQSTIITYAYVYYKAYFYKYNFMRRIASRIHGLIKVKLDLKTI